MNKIYVNPFTGEYLVDNADCGTGAGGFKPGNKCAKGGGAVSVNVRESANWVYFDIQIGEDKVGQMEGQIKDGWLRVREVKVKEEHRGKGYGVDLYEEAAKYAKSKGVGLSSDAATSESATRVWEALQRRGYKVQRKEAELDEQLKKFYAVEKLEIPGSKILKIRSGKPVWTIAASDL